MLGGSSTGFGTAPNAPFWLVSEKRTVGLVPGRYVLGRASDVEIQIVDDANVSRRHVRLIVTADVVEVEDLGSSNGTWLDGKLVQHPMRMPVGARLRVGYEEFELRRLRPPRRRRESATTSPDIPAARPLARDPDEMPEAATRQDTPVDMVYDQVMALLDKRKVEDAKRFVDPLLGLLELGHRALRPETLERVSVLGLGLADLARDGHYVDWVIAEHRRRGALMSARTVDLFERALFSGIPIDAAPFEAYITAIRELGLASGESARALIARIEEAASARGFTVPAPPPRD